MTLRQHLRVRQGETWSFSFAHQDSSGAPIDLTGWSARMSVRDQIGGVLEAHLSTEPADQDGGSITLGADGVVELSMTADETRRLTDNLVSASVLVQTKHRNAPEVEFVYDLELVDIGGAVTRVLEGPFIVSREVTE